MEDWKTEEKKQWHARTAQSKKLKRCSKAMQRPTRNVLAEKNYRSPNLLEQEFPLLWITPQWRNISAAVTPGGLIFPCR